MNSDENVPRTLWTYDDCGWLSTARRYTADGALLECITLTHDDEGHPQSQPREKESAITYIYDTEGRLVVEGRRGD